MKKLFLLLSAVFVLGSAEAQTPTLIKDINPKGNAFSDININLCYQN